jgi:hypothetical protein
MTLTIDPIVIVFLAGICVATAIIFGLAPTLRVSKTDVNEVMKEGGGRSGSSGIPARRWTGALIVADDADRADRRRSRDDHAAGARGDAARRAGPAALRHQDDGCAFGADAVAGARGRTTKPPP